MRERKVLWLVSHRLLRMWTRLPTHRQNTWISTGSIYFHCPDLQGSRGERSGQIARRMATERGHRKRNNESGPSGFWDSSNQGPYSLSLSRKSLHIGSRRETIDSQLLRRYGSAQGNPNLLLCFFLWKIQIRLTQYSWISCLFSLFSCSHHVQQKFPNCLLSIRPCAGYQLNFKQEKRLNLL